MNPNEFLGQNRLACVSTVLLVLGWVFFGAFSESGNYNPEGSGGTAALAFIIGFAPVAALLAAAGLIFDKRKVGAAVSLILSLISGLLVISIGG
jgi:hypothetical protein